MKNIKTYKQLFETNVLAIEEIFELLDQLDISQTRKNNYVLDYINSGWDITYTDSDGYNLLMIYCSSNTCLKIVKSLIKKGIDINIQSSDGESALHLAAEQYNIEEVKILIDAGAKLNLTDFMSFTATMRALANNHFDVFDLLVDSGADISIKNKYGDDIITYILSSEKDYNIETFKEKHPTVYNNYNKLKIVKDFNI